MAKKITEEDEQEEAMYNNFETDAEEGSTVNTEMMSRIKDDTEELILGTPFWMQDLPFR